MIDLKTCSRAQFFEHAQNLEGENKFLKSENHHLNERLQEYEGIQTDDEREKEFEKFFNDYGVKKNKKQTKALYFKLSKKKKNKIKKHLPLYKQETPGGLYRVTPDKYLRHDKFNDVIKVEKEYIRPKSGAKAEYIPPPPSDQTTVNISERIQQMK